ncbi:MAG: hypothetical protein WCG83_04660 [Candidatus Peregrinibacteria bacterium]
MNQQSFITIVLGIAPVLPSDLTDSLIALSMEMTSEERDAVARELQSIGTSAKAEIDEELIAIERLLREVKKEDRTRKECEDRTSEVLPSFQNS